MKHRPQTTLLHPALSCAADNIIRLYLKPILSIFLSRDGRLDRWRPDIMLLSYQRTELHTVTVAATAAELSTSAVIFVGRELSEIEKLLLRHPVQERTIVTSVPLVCMSVREHIPGTTRHQIIYSFVIKGHHRPLTHHIGLDNYNCKNIQPTQIN